MQDQALAIARKMFYAVDYTRSAYFRKYGNNDLYLMTCIGIYRLCDFLSIQNWPKIFALINMLCVDLGILFTCEIVRCMTDRRTALKAYMLCALNPLNVLLLQWTYTCTFSVPLMMAGIWLAVRMYYRRPALPVCAIGCVAIGCITAIGYYMRPTAVFPVIALILAVGFYKVHLWAEKRKKRDACKTSSCEQEGQESRVSRREFKTDQTREGGRSRRAFKADQMQEDGRSRRVYKIYQKVLLLLLTVTVMAGTAFSIRQLNSRYDPDNLTKFPLQHWIMIGIRGTGRVTGEDIHYTEKYETKEEKTAADQAAIKEALRERGAGGTFLHYVNSACHQRGQPKPEAQ